MDINLSSEKDRRKVMAAIMAGVNAFIEEEKAHEVVTTIPQRKPALVLSLWHVSGREEIMRMRTLWQRRIV